METFIGISLDIWMFLVIGAVFTGYGILDGFDLGAGTLHLFLEKKTIAELHLMPSALCGMGMKCG